MKKKSLTKSPKFNLLLPLFSLSGNKQKFFYSGLIAAGFISYLLLLGIQAVKRNATLSRRAEILEKKLEQLSGENKILREQLKGVDKEDLKALILSESGYIRTNDILVRLEMPPLDDLEVKPHFLKNPFVRWTLGILFLSTVLGIWQWKREKN